MRTIHKPFNKAVLLFVADEVSADNCAGYVLDRLITDDIGRVEDRHLALIRFACLYRLERRPGENGSNRSAASVRVRHVRGDANAIVTPFNEQRRRHPFPSFLCNLIDHGQVVVYFGRAELQGRGILTANRVASFDLWRSQLCSLVFQSRPLGIARAGCQHRSCKDSNREDKHPKDENSFGTWRRCGRRCWFHLWFLPGERRLHACALKPWEPPGGARQTACATGWVARPRWERFRSCGLRRNH